MAVDPQMQAIIDMMRESGAPRIGETSVAEMRQRMDVAQPPVADVHRIDDSTLPGPAGSIPIRIYRPVERARGLVVFYHGGGWTVGGLDSHDGMCRLIANATGCTVVSVDYRLSPENPFPAAVDDAWAALRWADAGRQMLTGDAAAPLIVMGDSAGGNLSAVMSILARDAGGPAIAQQVLIYPSTIGDIDAPEMSQFDPPILERRDIAWFYDQYIPREQRGDWRFAPAKAADLSRLPPATIFTCEYDLLAHEGVFYGEKLAQAGNPVSVASWDGAVHGFLSMLPAGDLGRRAVADIAREVEGVLAGASPADRVSA